MDTSDRMQPTARQCRARARSGLRCRRRPIKGGVVCHKHGGGAPQVKQSAAARIAALVDPALDALTRALRSQDLGAAVRAAKDLLDRAGLQATTKIDVAGLASVPVTAIERRIVEPGDTFARWLLPDQIAQVRQWKAEALARRDAGEPPVPTNATPDDDR